MLTTLIDQLGRSESLVPEQVTAAIGQLTDAQVSVEIKADFLIALAEKGESAEEIAAFARELRNKAVIPPVDESTRARGILDVVGTGGDRQHTFNISTTASLIIAAADVPVAKHGNRAVTSKCGSADVLEALGIPIDLSPEEASQSLRNLNFAFFFAPLYHPAFKHIGPARKLCAERGQRTLFNFLGPMLNPTRPAAQLIGVPRPEMCESLARVLQSLGIRRGMVVSGQIEGKQIDEFSSGGPTTIAEFYQDHGLNTSTWSPDDLPLQPVTLRDLAGGDAPANADIIRRILSGVEIGPKREAALLNAGAGLLVAGKAKTLSEGWELAVHLVAEGIAQQKLEELVSTHG